MIGLKNTNVGSGLVNIIPSPGNTYCLPNGKISVEDFHAQKEQLTEQQGLLLKQIQKEQVKISLYQQKLEEPMWTFMEQERFTSGISQSKQFIQKALAQLYQLDTQIYRLYHRQPIDTAKFYADIAPLLNELNDLLKAKAEAACQNSTT